MTESLVLLPGEMCSAAMYAPLVDRFAAVQAVTVAPVSAAERIEEMASGLLDQLPLRFALVGAGLGGVVALELLRRAPDRIARIALVSTTPLADTPQDAAERDLWIARARAGRLADAVSQMLPAEALAAGPGRLAVHAELQRMALSLGPDVFARQNRALQRRRDQQSTLRKCKVPALVVGGREDTILPPRRHEFMATLIPGARLCLIEGAGHLPVLEQPVAVGDALEVWLAEPR